MSVKEASDADVGRIKYTTSQYDKT